MMNKLTDDHIFINEKNTCQTITSAMITIQIIKNTMHILYLTSSFYYNTILVVWTSDSTYSFIGAPYYSKKELFSYIALWL